MEGSHETINRYSKILQYAPGLIVVSSTMEEGRLIEVNEAFEKTFKCHQEEIIGQSPAEFSFWANPQDHTWVVKTLRENSEVRDREIYFRDTTGNVFPGLYAGTIVEIDGEDCLLSVIMDITERKRAEEERVRLAAIVESSEDAIIGKTPDGIVTSWNRTAEKIYGYTAGEIIGRPISILAPPGRHDEMNQILERLRRGEHVKHFESVRLTRDGREIEVSLSISPIKDASGTLIGISTIARDITDRRKAIEALRESEKRYRLIFENMLTGFAYCKMLFDDREQPVDFVYLDVNNAYERLTGLKDVIGRNVSDVIQGIKTSAPEMFDIYGRVALTGEPKNFEIYLEALGNWFSVSAYSTEKEYFVAFFDVITERKLAEQELTESEDTLTALMNMMPVGVGWCDSKEVMEYVNSSFVDLFGYTIENIPTLTEWFSKAYPDPAYRKEIIALWEAAVDKSDRSGGPIEPIEANVTCKDGSVRLVIISTQLARNRTLMSFTDVTERDAIQDSLLNAQRLEALGVLAGGIAHNFNNILTGIMGNISLARMFLDAPEKTDQLLDRAEQASRRAAELVGQLLTFAKGGAPVKRPLSVSRLVHESVSLALHGTKVKAVVEIPVSLHDIEADPSQLSQVFNNILVNAVHAMPDGGSMTVRAGSVALGDKNRFSLPAGEYITLEFVDAGSGIAERDMKRIFDPYFTTKPSGTGIGLSSAHSIVKKHGGAIDVTSTVGKGTTFTLYLPSIGFTVTEKPSHKEATEVCSCGGGAVLVMDDELIVREIAAEMLRHLGYQVVICSSGEEAIEHYRTAKEAGSPFAAAILDLTVPGGLGGKETAQQILQIDPSARLIVSSGYSNDPIMAEYASHSFSAALAKPYIYEELGQVLLSLTRLPKD